MRSYPLEKLYGDQIITPHEINAEVAEIVAAAHTIDRDNRDPGTLAVDELAPGCFGNMRVTGVGLVANAVVFNNASSGVGAYHPIPNEAGGDWIEYFPAQDCVLVLELRAWMITNAGNLHAWIGIVLDGAMVAQSPIDPGRVEDTKLCHCVVPVGAGRKQLQMVFGVHESNYSSTITFTTRSLSIREAAR